MKFIALKICDGGAKCRMSDSDWNSYFDSLEKLNNKAAEISAKYYQDQISDLKENFVDKLRSVFASYWKSKRSSSVSTISSRPAFEKVIKITFKPPLLFPELNGCGEAAVQTSVFQHRLGYLRCVALHMHCPGYVPAMIRAVECQFAVGPLVYLMMLFWCQLVMFVRKNNA